MLTLEKLKAMKPRQIIATGIADDTEDGLFMLGTGRELLWVAVRGDIHDWAIYCGWAEDNSELSIIQHGDKVHSEQNIRKLVKCDDEAFNWYRH